MKCEKCNLKNFWLAVGSSDIDENYRCEKCDPPPSKSFVKKIRSSNPQAPSPSGCPSSVGDHRNEYEPLAPITINYEQPACPTCHCSIIVEVDLPTSLALRCWSCKRDLTPDDIARELSKPKPPRIINQHRHRAVYDRESGCVKIIAT